MSNQKGNKYPLWMINNDYQVVACDSNGGTHVMSDENFAMSISVSEDGTVWILSTEPDPDGGGAKIYWSNGDNNWNEIDTPEEGGIKIAGGQNSSCFYLSYSDVLYKLETDGTATVVTRDMYIIDMDYGGGYVWAIMDKEQNGKIGLYYSPVGSSLDFKKFAGDHLPYIISVDYDGNCSGAENFNPVYYSKDGSSTGSSGAGADGKTIQVSSKNWSYLLSTEIGDNNGNIVMEWVDTQGGVFEKTSFEGMVIAATYYRK